MRKSSCVACSFVMLLCTSESDLFLDANYFCMFLIHLGCHSLLLHGCACPDQVTQMSSFGNLTSFMESSDSRLRSLVSTLLFSNRLLSTSALPWVRQSKSSLVYICVSKLSFQVVVNFQ